METKTKIISLKTILIIIGLGIWVNVLQNAGIIPTNQIVFVKGGFIDTDVNGTVDINGRVSIDDEVDINIRHINGWEPANYYKYSRDGKDYHSLGTN